MYYPRYIERFGTGIKRINDACVEAGVKYEFRREKLGFTVVFYRPKDLVLDPVTGKPKAKFPERFSENFGENFGESAGLTDIQKRIVVLMKTDPLTSAKKLADDLGKSSRSIEYQISLLKAAGIIRRDGPDKGGRWTVMINNRNG